MIAGVCLTLAIGLVGAVVWARTASGNAWLLGTILKVAGPARGTLTAGSLATNLTDSLTLSDVNLNGEDGAVLVHVDEVDVAFDLGGILGRKLVVNDLAVHGVRVHLQKADGTCTNPLDLWDPGTSPGGPWTGIGLDIAVNALSVGADEISTCAGANPLVASTVTLSGNASITGPLVDTGGLRLAGLLTTPLLPEPTRFEATVVGSWDGKDARTTAVRASLGAQDLALNGEVTGLDTPNVLVAAHLTSVTFAPEPLGIPGIHGIVTATGEVKGRLDQPKVTLALKTEGGTVTIDGDADLSGDRPTWHADVAIPSELDLGATIDALPASHVAGHVLLDGSGQSWPDDLVIDGTADLTSSTFLGAGPYRVSGPIHLDHGNLGAPVLDIRTPAGSAKLTIRADVAMSTAAVSILDTDVDLAGLAAYGVPGLQGHVHFTGSLSGDWLDGGHARAEGVLRGGAFGYRDAATVASLAGPVRVTWDHDHGRFEAELQTGSVAVPADGRTVRASAVTATANLDFDARGVTGRVDSRATDVTVPTEHYDLLVANALIGPDDIEFAALGGGSEPDAAPDALPDVETIAAEGRYSYLGALSLTSAHYAPSAAVDWHLTEPASVTTANGSLNVHAAAASTSGATLAADGVLGPTRPCDFTASLKDFPLSTLALVLPGPAFGGTVTGNAHLKGTLAAPITTFEAHGTALVVPGILASGDADVTGTSDGRSVATAITLRKTRADDTILTVKASVGLRPGGDHPAIDRLAPLAAVATVSPSTSQAWRALLDPALIPAEIPDFRTAAQLTLSGTLDAPAATLSAGAQVRLPGGWVALDADAAVRDDVGSVRLVATQELTRRAEVTGTYGVALTRLLAVATGGPTPDLAKVVSNLALDVVPLQLPLTSLGAPPSVKGSLLGGLHVSGDPALPRVEGALMVINGAIGEVPISQAMVTLTGADGGYDVDAGVSFGGGGGLHAAGYVPVEANLGAIDSQLGRSGLKLTVDGDGVPLAAASAFVPGLTGAHGMAKLAGTVVGRADAPEPDLRLTLANGSFTIDPLNVQYDAVNLDAHLTSGGVDLTTLEATTRSHTRELNLNKTGRISASGHVALDHYRPGAVRGALELGNAWVANRTDVSVQATSSLRVAGTWPLLSIGGRVDVDDANVVLKESFFTAESSLQLDPDITVQRTGATVEKKVAVGLPFDVNMDIQVYLNRHTNVDVTIPMEQFGGDLTKSLSNLRFAVSLDSPDGLHLQREDGVVQLSGLVEPTSGVANVLGKDFNINGGTVSFTGVDYLNPLLNLGATYDSGANGTITAHISGSATAPGISFNSDLGKSTDDMISILLFGAPISDLQNSSQSSAAILAAFQSIFKSQMNEAASLTRLDVVQFSSDSYTFGKRFGKDVLVEIVFNNQNQSASTTVPKNPVELHVELPLWKGWYLQGMGGTAGIGQISAYARWRF